MKEVKRVYIAGKITGEPKGKVQEKFRKAEEWLKARGYEVVNPLDNEPPRELLDISFPKWHREVIKAYGNAIVSEVARRIFDATTQ